MMLSTRDFQWLFLIFGLTICIIFASSKEIRVVCYYTNWSVYRPGTAKFSPQNINPYLCTHLIYAFGGFTKENTLKPFDKYQDIEKGGYAKFTGLKTYNKDLKTLLAIGGWNEASSRFSPMVANADRRKQLVKNSIKFLRQNNFDGLDLDWEYPAFREGGKARDRENYAKLVQELREEFERESEKTGRTRLLLTMAVPAGIEYINKGYDIPKLTKYLDWMNILSYDYHSAFEPAVNHHAPLFPLREATEYDYDAELNIDYTIKHYLEMGADPNKLVMGVPTYGRSYTLFNPDANAIGDPADGPGEMGEATRENGYLAYYEICENVKSNGWTVVQPNDKAMGPYAYKENQWVGYDDENIARRKAEYVAQNGLGGIMFWAIDNDDFRGSCHGKPYPLIEAAKEALISASGLTDENLISPPSKPTKSKSRLRNRQKTIEEPPTEKSEVAQKTNSSRRRNRLKSKANNRVSDSDSKSKSRRNEAKKAETSTYSSLKVITPAYTTPEPPATPDQGGAFKCEDEGFYPHPKDCKKYFWCLSGPGELGIVAHQFTCPAGLFFNKAADSCDYSQNVLCNKKLSKTTSTTEGKKNVETAKTTTERISTTAATRRTTAKTTTTTEEEYDDEYEYEDEEIHDGKSDSEEDPRVIKELLDLIKKAGGIEELEKQLNIGHDEVKEGATTPSTRTKSIVEKFLTSRNNKNTSGNSKYTTINRNSRGPQNAGIEKDDDIPKKTDKRPQYTTISRKRPTPNKDEKEDDENEEKEEKPVISKYATIRRSKEGLTVENRPIVDRNKILGEEDRDTEDSNRREVTVHTTPQYVNIRRQRPTTTTDQSSTAKYVSIRRSTTADSLKEEEKEEPTTSRNEVSESPITEKTTPSLRYQTLNRQATTTTTEIASSTEPTTTREVPSTQRDINTTPDVPSTTYSRSTEVASTTTTEVTDEPSSSPSSTAAVTSSTSATSTEETKLQTTKSPVLFEPRPFSKSTISTTHKPVRTNIRSTASPSKVSDTTVRSRFRRPFVNKNIDNADGVSDNSVESESSTENVSTTRRILRNKSRFSRPDVAINEDSTAPAKPAFRQRLRPVSSSSTQKTITDNEQDEIQRKYRPLSLDDLSSLTAADITIQKGSRDGGFRRTRLRTTTTDTPEEVSTTKRKSFERSRISSTGRTTTSSSTTEKTFIDEEQNEIRFENRSRNSDNTSESPKVTTTRRRTFYRPRISTVEPTSSEINNDLNDQIKSGTDEIQLGKQSRNESSGSDVIRRPAKRMRKVLKRLRTSTSSPSTAAVTYRGKSLSYADLDRDIVTTSEGLSSTSGLILVDADSNEASISDETIDEDENIKLSATNIRENSNINNGNAIYDIGFRKFKKAEIVFDKTRYGSKYDVETTTSTTTTTADYGSPKSRKFIRRFRPTEPTSQQESPTTKTYGESSTETKPGRGRKVIRRLRPNTKSFSDTNLDTSSEASLEKITKSYRAPQFFEKRRQYYNRDSIKITKNSNFNRKLTTEDSVSTQSVYNRFGNVKDTGTTSSSEETETNFETTTHRGTLRYVDIVRSTTSTESSADQTDENEKDRAFYFTTPHALTLADGSSGFSSTTNYEITTFSSHYESRETEESTQNVSELSETKTEKMTTQFEETPQKSLHETTETISSDTASSEFTTTPAEVSTFMNSKIVEDTSVSSDATDDVEVLSTINPENETTNLTTEDVSTLSSTFETTTPTTTTEYTRKSTLRSSRLRPTYQIRRSTTSTTTKTPKESKLSEKSPKFFTRRKPSFRQKSTTEPNSSQEKPSEKPRRRYPFSKYGRVSTTASYTDVDQLETKTSTPENSSIESISEENVSAEKSQPKKQRQPNFFTKSTTEVYQTSTESNKSTKSDTAEKQKLRNKSLFSKKRKMNIPIYSSPEVKEEPTTEHYTTLYHVFAEPEVHENDTNIMMNNETNVNEEGRIEPLVEINRIIEVHIKNENDNSSGVNNEAKSIFDKIGAINRVTSIKVVDGNGTKIADLPLDQTSQRLAVVHDIIAQEKKNEAISEHRKERKFDFDVKGLPNNELKNGVERPEIIDGISHIKVITPKPILSAEVSTIALEALFSTTEKSKISEDKNSTSLAENELLDTEYSRFVNIRVIKPVDGRSLSDDVPADTPKVVKLLSSDEEVTMEAKVVEVTPKNLDQTIRIAPIQVAMARTIADTPIIGIKRLNEKISNTPFRSSLDSGEH